jgi:hypothetical protein
MYSPYSMAATVTYPLQTFIKARIPGVEGPPRRETMLLQRYSDCCVCGTSA